MRLALKYSMLSLTIILTAQTSLAQPDTLWTQTFGGNEDDLGSSMQQTSDGGYIIAGRTYSYGAGDCDVYLIKTDSTGNEQWSQTFGGSDWDTGKSVQQTSDGGYIITGDTQSSGAGSSDVYLIKTDDTGTELWSQTIGGRGYDIGYSIQQTSDGGYIITGRTYSYGAGESDVYLIKTDATGNEQWSQTFGGSTDDWCFSVQQTSDGGYILAGITEISHAVDYDIYLIKTDASGTEQWSRTFGGNGYDLCYNVLQTSDGGFILSNLTDNYGAGLFDAYLIKTDASGTEQWSQTYGGSNWDGGYGVQPTSDGGYIIVGYTRSYGAGHKDIYLIKTDTTGNEQWSQAFGGSSEEHGIRAQQTSDGGYIIAGFTNSFGAGEFDIWLIRLDADVTGVSDPDLSQSLSNSLLSAYPNPFNPNTVISYRLQTAGEVNISVYDVSGRQVVELVSDWCEAGVYEVVFDGSGLSTGMYIYRFSDGMSISSGKIMLMD